MQKQEGKNVKVSAIYGNFDDAQSFLKTGFHESKSVKDYADRKGRAVFQCQFHQHSAGYSRRSYIMCRPMRLVRGIGLYR
jgi:hypothetical protein